MIKCPKCGAELEDGAKFCDKCGEKVSEQSVSLEKASEKGAAPQNKAPQGAPQNAMPQNAAPQGAPQNATPQGAPQNAAPQNAAPQGAPQNAAPQNRAPQGAPQPVMQQAPVMQGGPGSQPNFNSAPQSAVPPMPDPTDHTSEFAPEDIKENRLFALCPYIFSLVGAIIALLAKKDSPFVAFHVKQGLKITMCQMILVFVNIIPFLGQAVCGICEIILMVVLVISFINTCQGKAKEPVIIQKFGFLK